LAIARLIPQINNLTHSLTSFCLRVLFSAFRIEKARDQESFGFFARVNQRVVSPMGILWPFARANFVLHSFVFLTKLLSKQ
jgi:hypothetical protein